MGDRDSNASSDIDEWRRIVAPSYQNFMETLATARLERHREVLRIRLENAGTFLHTTSLLVVAQAVYSSFLLSKKIPFESGPEASVEVGWTTAMVLSFASLFIGFGTAFSAFSFTQSICRNLESIQQIMDIQTQAHDWLVSSRNANDFPSRYTQDYPSRYTQDDPSRYTQDYPSHYPGESSRPDDILLHARYERPFSMDLLTARKRPPQSDDFAQTFCRRIQKSANDAKRLDHVVREHIHDGSKFSLFLLGNMGLFLVAILASAISTHSLPFWLSLLVILGLVVLHTMSQEFDHRPGELTRKLRKLLHPRQASRPQEPEAGPPIQPINVESEDEGRQLGEAELAEAYHGAPSPTMKWLCISL